MKLKTREMTYEVTYTTDTKEEKTVEINGIAFFYDGCHKIYVVEKMEDIETMKKIGYEGKDLYSMNDLKDVYENSCPLRFISSVDLETRFIPQCSEVTSFNGVWADKDIELGV